MKKEQERKAKSNKGKTQWYPRHQAPARQGTYECLASFLFVSALIVAARYLP